MDMDGVRIDKILLSKNEKALGAKE
jgi:hypothetical protein